MPSLEEFLLTFWFFVMGGVIGSFLNVVVYRLPLGLSLIHPPSHCPKCKNLIRWYCNIPVFAWLILRGKCRECGQPISPRYPVVELTTAIMFGVIMVLEFAYQGINLPSRIFMREDEIIPLITSSADRYLIVIYHLTLLSVLLCGWLIEFDRQQPPKRMYVWTIICGLIFPLQWPALRPMNAWPSEPLFLAGGIEGLIGLAAGGTIAFILWKLQRTRQAGGLPWGVACVGVFLGWQPVLPIALAAASLGLVTAIFMSENTTGRNKKAKRTKYQEKTIRGQKIIDLIDQERREWTIPASAWLWLLTFCWILFWSPLVTLLNLP